MLLEEDHRYLNSTAEQTPPVSAPVICLLLFMLLEKGIIAGIVLCSLVQATLFVSHLQSQGCV